MKQIKEKHKSLNLIFYFMLSVFYVFSLSCKDNSTDEPDTPESSIILLEKLNAKSDGGITRIDLKTKSPLTISIPTDAQSWCSAKVEDSKLIVEIKPNKTLNIRNTTITLKAGSLTHSLKIDQNISEDLASTKEKKVSASKVEATSFEEGFEPEKSIDGDPSTYFNSKFGAISSWPFNIDYYFSNVSAIDFIMYTPRQDTGNRWGAFGRFELWVATADNPTLRKYGEYDFNNETKNSSRIYFNESLVKPTRIRFAIHSAFENRVSCGEMDFFQNPPYLELFFADMTCTKLRDEITLSDIEKIPDPLMKNIAIALFNKTYDGEYRIEEYRPYQHPDIMADINKTERYSKRDNPTGIFAKDAGEEIIVFIDDTKGQKLSLTIQDLNVGFDTGSSEYSLNKGLNRIIAKNPGLMYINNFTNDNIPLILESESDKAKAKAKTVKIHIASGSINGYFNSEKHKESDWAGILNKAKYQDIDVFGKYAHITWRAKDYKDAATPIVTMLDYFDQLVYQQQEFSGLFKYNKAFRNRMYFHVAYSSASPHAAAYRTGYTPNGYSEVFCKPDRFRARLWVAGHEVGHINQVRPGVKWTGMTEVTNNLFAMYNQQKILGKAVRLDGEYPLAKAGIINLNKPLILPDNYGQHMWKIVPFWQLKLYVEDAKGQTDFYKDLFELYRSTPDPDTSVITTGICQLNFVRNACNLAKIDLLEFFEAWGFLTPLDVEVNDYGVKPFKITQAQVDAVKNEISKKNYPKPTKPVHDITDSNVDSYK